MTKKEITRIVMEGATGEYSHCIIYCDHFDYTDSCQFVKYGENINKVINDIKSGGSPGMFSIMEIYNYNLDITKQLNEKRAYHIEPINKTRKGVIKNEEDTLKQSELANDEDNNNISDELKKAIEYATKMHEGQTRLTGEAYIKHPLHVIQNVLKYKKSKNIETLLISACLHDTLEDTEATYYDIVQNFGPQVASLVLELTTDEDIKNILGKQQYLSIKMKNMSSWALVIKLCDRLDNTNDLLNCQDDSFKNRYINETIGIIDYLLKNAKLSKTHITIIEQIICLLIQLSKGDNEKTIKLAEIVESFSKLKISFKNENDIFNKLIKIANSMDNNNDYKKNLLVYK